MNAHPEVMLDLGGSISRAMSDAKLDRYVAAFLPFEEDRVQTVINLISPF